MKACISQGVQIIHKTWLLFFMEIHGVNCAIDLRRFLINNS